MGSSLTNLSKRIKNEKDRPTTKKSKAWGLSYQYHSIGSIGSIITLSLSIFIYLTIINNAKSSKIELKNMSGAQISGLLVKKSETKIEVQTTHGTLILKEKDLAPQSWEKAQNTITSRPLPTRDDKPMPPPKPIKEINVSYQPEKDTPTPTLYTGFAESLTSETLENLENPNSPNSPEIYQRTDKKTKELFKNNPIKDSKDSKDIIDTNYFSVVPLLNNLTQKSYRDSKNLEQTYPIQRIIFPITILGICLTLLYHTKAQLRIKLTGYLILAILGLSITLQNSTLGIIAIGFLCIFMLVFEFLASRKSRKLAIKQALGIGIRDNPTELELKMRTGALKPDLTPNIKTLRINPNHLNRLEWKRFEDFCRAWLEQGGFEITKITPHPRMSQSTHNIIEGFCPSKNKENGETNKGKKFRAIHVNWNRPAGIREIKTIRKLCTSTEIPILISTGGFEKEAIQWAKDDKVRIIGNKELTEKFKVFPKEIKEKIIKNIWDSDHEVPTCPVCRLKMIKMEDNNTEGNNLQAPKFWICKEYKNCHQRVKIQDQIDQLNEIIKEDKVYPDFSQDPLD